MRNPINHHLSPTAHHRTGIFWQVLLHPAIIFLWILATLFASIQLISSAFSSRTVLDEKALQERLLKKEEQKGFDIIQKVDEAQTDFAKEKIIRDELHMQKPGEKVLQLPSSPAP